LLAAAGSAAARRGLVRVAAPQFQEERFHGESGSARCQVLSSLRTASNGSLRVHQLADPRGLLARFLHAVPADLVGYRPAAAEPLPDPARLEYHRGITALLALPMAVDGHGEARPQQLVFSAEAAERLVTFEQWLEP
jgi:hypothetical protein